MSEINANFVVETIGLTIDQSDPGITVTPEVINMTLYTAGYAVPGGNVGDLQYNAGGYIGGIPTANYLSNNLNLGNVNAVKILGGTNTYFLQTDGTGNLTFAPGTVVANTGNGIASGANTQIQITDGTGNFVSGAGFTFDYLGNTLSVPGDGLFTGNITSGNANLGNLATANYFSGNFIGVLANGTSNIRIFANSNIAFSVAGNSNVAVITGTQLTAANANIVYVEGITANYTSITGVLTAGSANQPNITNVGSLGILKVIGNTSIGNLIFGAEKVNIIGAQSGTYNYDVLDNCIQYSNANAAANLTLNFRGNSGTPFSSVVTTGQSLTATYIMTNGSTPYGVTAVQVDGSAKTIKWVGNNIPTQSANTLDAYVFTIIGITGDYLVLGSKSRFG